MRPIRYHRVALLFITFPLTQSNVGCAPTCERSWYADLDGDGYGDRDSRTKACERPDAHTADASDCDDTKPSIHPDAVEVCNGIDDDCDGEIDPDARTWFLDLDDDGYGDPDQTVQACAAPEGYTNTTGDCDDGDASVFPGALVEYCDGKDQDCDGLVDEGAEGTVLWYPDDDLDGWGFEPKGRAYCAPPAGWITRAGDCDDTNPDMNPDRVEVCNAIDDDCDGFPNEADPQGADGMILAYPDNDGDGYGDPNLIPTSFCSVPAGWVTEASDCDDTDPDIHPGGTEVCGGGDEDCDALIDEADPSLDESTTISGWTDADGDGYGDPGPQTVACSLGEGVVGNDEDCDDSDPRTGPDLWQYDADADGGGAGIPVAGEGCAAPEAGMINILGPEDCDDLDPAFREGLPDPCGDGLDQDCSGVDPSCGPPLDAILDLSGVARGWSHGTFATDGYDLVAAGGDIDGDGFGDAVLMERSLTEDSELLVYSGPGPEVAGFWEPRLRLPVLSNLASDDSTAALVPDFTGDGGAELAIGLPDADAGTERGYVFLLPSPDLGLGASTVQGDPGDRIGSALASTSDLEGTGDVDLIVGAPVIDEVGVFQLEGANVVFSDAALRLAGSAGEDFGTAVACCADLDGNGSGDLVVGAVGTSANDGAVYVVDTLDLWGAVTSADLVTASVYNGASNAALGAAVAAGADFDDDGNPDVIAAAPEDDAAAPAGGSVYILTAPTDDAADLAATYIVRGADAAMRLAQSVALVDLDGDGVGDLVAGADSSDLGGLDSGAVYVFYGPAAGDVSTDDADAVLFGDPGSRTGGSIAIGPIDADPTPDLWIAQPGLPGGGAWLVPGP